MAIREVIRSNKWILLGAAFCCLAFADETLNDNMMRAVFNRHIPSAKVGQFKNVQNPVNIIAVGADLIVASFMVNTVIVNPVSSKTKPYLLIDNGIHCGQKCATLDGPWGLAFLPTETSEISDANGYLIGELFVSSFGSDQILQFRIFKHHRRLSAFFVSAFGDSETLDCPEGLAFDPSNGLLHVSSFLSDSIVIFKKEARDGYVFEKVLANKTTGQLNGPEDICFLPNGDLVVASYYSDTVSVYNSNNSPQVDFRSNQLRGPVGVLCLEDNSFLVSSYKTNKIIHFRNPSEHIVFAAGGGIRGPSGMAIGGTNSLFIASYENNIIVAFNISTGASYDLASIVI